MSSFIVKSNVDLVLRMIRENNAQAAEAAGNMAVESVQEKILYGYKELHGRPPHTEIVDTGRLFDSIQAVTKMASQNTMSITVGTNVPYAKYVHEGYKQPAGLKFQDKDGNWYTTKGRTINGRPYISDGLMAIKEEIESAVGSKWKNGF